MVGCRGLSGRWKKGAKGVKILRGLSFEIQDSWLRYAVDVHYGAGDVL